MLFLSIFACPNYLLSFKKDKLRQVTRYTKSKIILKHSLDSARGFFVHTDIGIFKSRNSYNDKTAPIWSARYTMKRGESGIFWPTMEKEPSIRVRKSVEYFLGALKLLSLLCGRTVGSSSRFHIKLMLYIVCYHFSGQVDEPGFGLKRK